LVPGFALAAENFGGATLFREPAFHASIEAFQEIPPLVTGEGFFVEFGCGWRDRVGCHGRHSSWG
jgi:hypothetical protein